MGFLSSIKNSQEAHYYSRLSFKKIIISETLYFTRKLKHNPLTQDSSNNTTSSKEST